MLMKLFFSDEKTALIGNADCLNNLVIFTVILQMKKMCILKWEKRPLKRLWGKIIYGRKNVFYILTYIFFHKLVN